VIVSIVIILVYVRAHKKKKQQLAKSVD
jgi:hypothetical protein